MESRDGTQAYFITCVADQYHIFMIKNGVQIQLTKPWKPLSLGQLNAWIFKVASGQSSDNPSPSK